MDLLPRRMRVALVRRALARTGLVGAILPLLLATVVAGVLAGILLAAIATVGLGTVLCDEWRELWREA